MKIIPCAFTLCLGLFLGGCASGIGISGPEKFDALNPGGPVYAPQEMVALEPMPTDPPHGNYFDGSDHPAPAEYSDPYWIRGFWGWNGRYWEWVPGTWVDRPKPGLLWINPSSIRVGSHIFWKTGYWE